MRPDDQTLRTLGLACGLLAALEAALAGVAHAAEPESGAAAAQAPQVTWLGHDAALGQARESGKPVMIHFTADWCRWCVKMKQETYTDPRVAELLASQFVTAMVDADRSPALKAAYRVQGLPTIWFLTAEGEGITYLPGFVDARTFAPVLRWIATGAYQTQSFDEFQKGEG